jgi:Tol biopolymer transport system component/imidazolonepropionase-like amidohydrolase
MNCTKVAVGLLSFAFAGVVSSGAAIPKAFHGPATHGAVADDEKKDADKKNEGLPLKSNRKLEFTTDEGTWISLDVSPDNGTIVFELVGQLYTIPIGGGEAKRITDGGLAFNAQPKFSPDGQWIAFTSDRDGARNLWISKTDGSDAKKLSADTKADFISPSWTPDGQFIVVTKLDGLFAPENIWMYNMHGGSGIAVPAPKLAPDVAAMGGAAGAGGIGVVASPDGRYLYYAGGSYNHQIKRRDRVTGEEISITDAPGGGMRPVLSPDGQMLVYATRHEAQTGLRIMNLETQEDRSIKFPVQRDASEGGSERDLMPGYAFLSNGQELIASYGGKIHRIGLNDGQDRIIPFTVHVSQALGPKLDFPTRVDDGPTLQARLLQDPVESPDGKRLAFSALGHVYVMDLPNGTPKRFTHASAQEGQPAWSPDGQWIAYVSYTATGGQLWKASANGQGEPQQLTKTPAYYAEPAWSPDGTRIVAFRAPVDQFLKNSLFLMTSMNPRRDLFWISSEGGRINIVAADTNLNHPHFTKAGDRIYLNTAYDFLSMRWDGSDRQMHLRFDDKGLYGAWTLKGVTISPDGKSALVRFRNQLYLMPMPQIGGDAPMINMPSGQQIPAKKLTDIAAEYYAWADNGATITWSLGSKFFRQPVSSISFEEKKKEGESTEKKPDDGLNMAEVRKQEKAPVEVISVAVDKPRYKPQGIFVLRGAQVVTMKGDEVIANADIVVTDNRITGVGKRGSVSVPANAKVIDVHGATIVPGFIDLHPHWNEVGHTLTDVQSWPLFAALAYGVTAGRDPQTSMNDMFVYQDLIEAGEIPGPRTYSTGPGLYVNSDFQSAEEAYSALAKFTDYYHTKFFKSYMIGNRKQREWVVDACRRLGIMPTTEGGINLSLDMTHALDGYSGNEHSLPIVPLYKDVAELFTQANTTDTPTLLVAYGGPSAEDYFFERFESHDDAKLRRFVPDEVLDTKFRTRTWHRDDEYVFPKIAESALKIVKAGGNVCIGAHGELQGLGYHFEMWAMKMGGWSNMEVLRAATLSGAKALGYEQDLGSIEVGKLADMVVLSKDPLQDLHNTTAIRYIVKNGQVFEGDTLNAVWPEAKPLPAMWFWNEKP